MPEPPLPPLKGTPLAEVPSKPDPPPPLPVFADPSPPTPSAGYVIPFNVVPALIYPPFPPTRTPLTLPPDPGAAELRLYEISILPPPPPPPPANAPALPVIVQLNAFPPSPDLVKAVESTD
jgi:hypothetical protein